MDSNQFIAACNRMTADEVIRYSGRWLAWSVDGSHILTDAADEDELYRNLDALGSPGYVVDYIPIDGEDFIGGGLA